MRKIKVIGIVAAIVLYCCGISSPVSAEDYSDTQYWTSLCTDSSGISSSDKEACQGFYDYMKSQSASLTESISSIDSQREEIAANIEEYATKIKDYQTEIDDLKVQIDDL